MEEALTALLLADAGVAALVADRIRWGRAEQGEAKPYIVLTKIFRADSVTYQSAGNLPVSRVQVDCYGTTYASATATSRAVILALNGKGGGAAATIDRIFLDTERGLFDDDPSPEELFRMTADYRVFHRP